MGTDAYAVLSHRRAPRIQKHAQTLSGDLKATGMHTPTSPSRTCFLYLPGTRSGEFTSLGGAPRAPKMFAQARRQGTQTHA